MAVTVVTKEVNLMALHKVIRTHQTYLLRLASELGEIRPGPQTGRRLPRLPVQPQMWPGPTHTGLVADT